MRKMDYAFWAEVDGDLPLEDFYRQPILAFEGDNGVLLTISHYQSEHGPAQSRVQYARLSSPSRQTSALWPPYKTIGATVRELLPHGRPRIVASPPFVWNKRGEAKASQWPMTIVVAIVVFLLVVVVGQLLADGHATYEVLAALVAPFVAFGAGAATYARSRESLGLRVLAAGNDEIGADNLVEYATARLAGERPEAVRDVERIAQAKALVDEIRAEYGQLELDIVFRIDNPAFFDAAAPTTERFITSLVAFDEAGDTTAEEAEWLAHNVEMAYSIARDHAKVVGLNHLPEDARDEGRRASKAARLAVRAGSAGERLASIAQVKRILDSLALYYMPTVDGETLALEPPPGK